MSALAPDEIEAIAKAIAAESATQQMAAPAAGGEYLTYRIGGEEYAMNVLSVQEIRTFERPTRIANAPAHLLGVINLRGVIVPIYDVRLMLGCAGEFTSTTVVIVLNMGSRTVGVVVDSVCDVFQLNEQDVRVAPKVGAATDNFVTAIATLEQEGAQRTVFLVSVEHLLALS